MPVYEYLCDACGHHHEHLAKSMYDRDPVQCPKCNAKKLRKKLSLFAPAAGAAKSSPSEFGGCGRCGDPNGPCS